MDRNMTSEERFESILVAKDEDFDHQRIALFADPKAIHYLSQRISDPDPVTAFTARQLYLWATEKPHEFKRLDEFLETGVLARREQLNRTAAGWQPNLELSIFLTLQANRRIDDYLLLVLLMKPKVHSDWVFGGALEYFANHPVSDPATWIRKALEYGETAVYDHLANLSLRVTDKSATLRALNFERARCQRTKQVFPPQLEALRKELAKGVVPGQ